MCPFALFIFPCRITTDDRFATIAVLISWVLVLPTQMVGGFRTIIIEVLFSWIAQSGRDVASPTAFAVGVVVTLVDLVLISLLVHDVPSAFLFFKYARSVGLFSQSGVAWFGSRSFS